MSHNISIHRSANTHITTPTASHHVCYNRNDLMQRCFSFVPTQDMILTVRVNKIWNKIALPIIHNNASRELQQIQQVLKVTQGIDETPINKISSEKDFYTYLNGMVAKMKEKYGRLSFCIFCNFRWQYDSTLPQQPMDTLITEAFFGRKVAYVEKLDILVGKIFAQNDEEFLANRFEYYFQLGNLIMAEFVAELHPQMVYQISFMMQIAIKLVEKNEVSHAIGMYKKYVKDIYKQSRLSVAFVKHREFFASLEKQGCHNELVEIFRISNVNFFENLSSIKPENAMLILNTLCPIVKYPTKKFLDGITQFAATLIGEGHSSLAFYILEKLEAVGASPKGCFLFFKNTTLQKLIKRQTNLVQLLSKMPKHRYTDIIIEDVANAFINYPEQFFQIVHLLSNPKKKDKILSHFKSKNLHYFFAVTAVSKSQQMVTIAPIAYSKILSTTKSSVFNNGNILKICCSYLLDADMVAATQINKVWNKTVQPILQHNLSKVLLEMQKVLVDAKFLSYEIPVKKINTIKGFDYYFSIIAQKILKQIPLANSDHPYRGGTIFAPSKLMIQYEQTSNSLPVKSDITLAFLGKKVAYVEKLDILVACHLFTRDHGYDRKYIEQFITFRFEYYMQLGNLSMAQFAAEHHPQAIEKISFMIQIAIKLVEKHEITHAIQIYKKYANDDIYKKSPQGQRVAFTKHLEFLSILHKEKYLNELVDILSSKREELFYRDISYVPPVTAKLILETFHPILKPPNKRILECYMKCAAQLIDEGHSLMVFDILRKLEIVGISINDCFELLRSKVSPRKEASKQIAKLQADYEAKIQAEISERTVLEKEIAAKEKEKVAIG